MLATILQEEYLVLTFVYSIPKKILKEKEKMVLDYFVFVKFVKNQLNLEKNI